MHVWCEISSAGGIPERTPGRKSCPGDVSEVESALVVPCLTLINEETPQPVCSLRDRFDTLAEMPFIAFASRMLRRLLPVLIEVHHTL